MSTEKTTNAAPVHGIVMRHSEIKGGQFGVRFEPRGQDDPHVCIQLLSEDDTNWFEVGNSFSSFWLDDLIAQLTAAKTLLEQGPKDPAGFGYRFDA
jgi:hypothetical protein